MESKRSSSFWANEKQGRPIIIGRKHTRRQSTTIDDMRDPEYAIPTCHVCRQFSIAKYCFLQMDGPTLSAKTYKENVKQGQNKFPFA